METRGFRDGKDIGEGCRPSQPPVPTASHDPSQMERRILADLSAPFGIPFFVMSRFRRPHPLTRFCRRLISTTFQGCPSLLRGNRDQDRQGLSRMRSIPTPTPNALSARWSVTPRRLGDTSPAPESALVKLKPYGLKALPVRATHPQLPMRATTCTTLALALTGLVCHFSIGSHLVSRTSRAWPRHPSSAHGGRQRRWHRLGQHSTSRIWSMTFQQTRG